MYNQIHVNYHPNYTSTIDNGYMIANTNNNANANSITASINQTSQNYSSTFNEYNFELNASSYNQICSNRNSTNNNNNNNTYGYDLSYSHANIQPTQHDFNNASQDHKKLNHFLINSNSSYANYHLNSFFHPQLIPYFR